ncbi:MAG TPA: methionine--tRNA ligase, partial [Prolixibacteraceae bacterium]|nr:methionine--tRNA ligase [Prolixibacteraceae bacterium]
DIRTGTVLAAEKVAKTQKLLKLTIDTGIDKRTVVSGIAEHYTPEEMVGKQVCILVNLEPRPLKGIESKGMILCAQDPTGKLVLVKPESLVRNGSEVK